MKRSLVLSSALLVLTVGLRLSAQAPQPGPEVKKLEQFTGTWTYTGDAAATPMGPASKVSGSQTGRMVMGGFALELTGQEKGAFGGVQWQEMDVYDAASKTYPYFGYQNDGTIWAGSGTVSGGVWKWTGTITSKGVTYKYRNEGSFSADGKTFTSKNEISTDSKTWAAWSTMTMKKN